MADFAKLVLDADTSGLKRGEQALRDVGKQASTTAGQVDTSSAKIAAGFKQLGIAAVAAFSVDKLIDLGRNIVRLSDTYTSMNAQLRLVTGSAQELANAEARLFEMSQRNRVGFESTVELYARIARSSQALGASQSDILRVTDTINKALVISGTSAQQASGALMQLGQAFASGTLRGDELNSVLEGMPRVAQAIAEGMGVTVGRLRELGAQGVLTSEEVFNALLKMSQGIDQEFGRMPATVGQAFTVLGNSVLKLVGEINEGAGASAGLASAIMGIAQAIDAATPSVGAFVRTLADTGRGLSELARGLSAAASGFLGLKASADVVTRGMANFRAIMAQTFPIITNILDALGRVGRAARIRDEIGLGAGNAMKSVSAIIADSGVQMKKADVAATGFAGSLAKIGGGGGGGARAAAGGISEVAKAADEAYEKLQRLRSEFASVQNQLDPDLARERRRGEQMGTITDAARAGVGTQTERLRALGQTFEVTGKLEDMQLMTLKFADTAKTAAQSIGDSFGTMADRALGALDRLAQGIQRGDFLSILGGILNLGLQLGGMGVFSKTIQGNIRSQGGAVPSFAGGGFTGTGARSGGVDGKGGFMAVLHPNETVTDHTKGGGRQSVVVINNSALAEAFVDERIVGAAPAIMQGGAQIAQQQLTRQARRRT